MPTCTSKIKRDECFEPTKILHDAWKQSKHETGAATALLCTLQNNVANISSVEIARSYCVKMD